MINKALYKFCGNTKKYIYLAVFAEILRLLMGIAFAFVFAGLIASVIGGESPQLIMVAIAVATIIFKIIFTRLSAKYNFKVVREVKHNLRTGVYKKVLDLGMAYQGVLTTQEVTHLGVEGVEQLENYYGGYLTQFYYCFASSIILFIVVFPIDVLSAFILMLASLLIPITLQAIMGIVRKTQRKYWNKYSDIGNLFLDSLTGITTLKIFEADEKRADDMDDIAEGFRKQTMKVLAMQLNSIVIIDWIAYISTAVVIGINVWGYVDGKISVVSVAVMILLAAEFFIPMKALTAKFHVAMTGVAAGERILDFLEYEEIYESGEEVFPNEADIEVKNLSFSYPDGTEVLKDIDVKFESGKFTALVGRSGCGKSTLASLVCGHLKTPEGISYSGVKKSNLMRGELEKNIVRITHDPHIFAATVRDNIVMGKEGIDDAQVIETLKDLNMWAFLEGERGLDTMLLSGGKNISGGQAQRISIARALVSDFQVYIFDESTSNVDIESENIIIDMVKKLSETKTVIYITHKMSVVSLTDYVHVMKDGLIIQSGTPEELIEEDGLYRDLHREQEDLKSLYDKRKS